jgi:hypothetical protein
MSSFPLSLFTSLLEHRTRARIIEFTVVFGGKVILSVTVVQTCNGELQMDNHQRFVFNKFIHIMYVNANHIMRNTAKYRSHELSIIYIGINVCHLRFDVAPA